MPNRTQTAVGHAAAGWLTAGSLTMLLALLVGGRLAEWTVALVAAVFPVLLIALGTRRTLHRSRATFLAVLALVLGLAAVGLLWLSGPLAIWLMLGGLGLVPLVLVTWFYTVTFDDG